MSILPHFGWAAALIWMCLVLGGACWACAYWDSKFRHENFRSSHPEQFANSSRRAYVSYHRSVRHG